MPLVQSYYARDDDDVALGKTVTASAADSGYPAANLVTRNPAKPAKLATMDGWWVVDLGSAMSIAGSALIYQYLTAGLDVRIQGNTSDSWGSPAFSTAITIPAKRKDGPTYQRWTKNPVTTFDTPQTYRYWRLYIAGTNDQNVVVGRLMLLAALRPVTLFHDGDIGEDDKPVAPIDNRTQLQVRNVIVIGGPQRSVTAILLCTDLDAGTEPIQEAQDFRDLWESTDQNTYPFLLVFTDLLDGLLVHFTEFLSKRLHRQGGYQVWPFSVEEESRGLPWP